MSYVLNSYLLTYLNLCYLNKYLYQKFVRNVPSDKYGITLLHAAVRLFTN